MPDTLSPLHEGFFNEGIPNFTTLTGKLVPRGTLPLFAGIMASMLHVISGPDHLAAVTPLVVELKRKGWKVGLSWGFGHLIGMLLIGVLFLIYRKLSR